MGARLDAARPRLADLGCRVGRHLFPLALGLFRTPPCPIPSINAVYTDVPYGDSAHFYYVRPDLPETAELVRQIQQLEYIYWRSGVRAVNLAKSRL